MVFPTKNGRAEVTDSGCLERFGASIAYRIVSPLAIVEHEDLREARDWVDRVVRSYNEKHRHSAIRFVTPSERHHGQDAVILQRRDAIYRQAKQKNPFRWTGSTRNRTPIGDVWLNPES